MDLKSKVSISMCLLLTASICFYSIQVPTVHSLSWGAHRFVAQKAIDIMPDSLDWFFSTYSSTIVSYSTMPDQWKSSDPYEGNRHWFDVDLQGGGGTLPLAVEDNFGTFVQYLSENDWDHAAQLAGVISHYIADASNPLHGTSDYDPGGNHGAFESTVDSHLGEMNMDMPGFVLQELRNFLDSTVQLLEEGYSYSSVLNPYLRSGILWNDEIKNMTENRLRTGAQLLANIWYTGMIRASLVIGSVATLSPHSPIYIDGDDNFILANGATSGSGTENDPYIIENWVISAESAHGIEIRNTTVHFVIRNCLVENGGLTNDGLYLEYVINGRVENCIIRNNWDGIHLYKFSNSSISGNICRNNNLDGICLDHSDNNSISGNKLENNYWSGIYLISSGNAVLRNNVFVGCGLFVYSSYNNSVENSWVNGRPLVYLEEESDLAVSEAGQVVLVNCDNITVRGLDLPNVNAGVVLWGTSKSKVMNNTTSYRYYGIWLNCSDNNSISGNKCENNSTGIRLYASDNNTISGNTFLNSSYYGIWLWFSENNSISGNTCSNNGSGIYLESSGNNFICHNNFISNVDQAYDNDVNSWDNGYPSGGNYWSDYTCVDHYRGKNQDQLGSDGIGDTSYYIPGDNNRDRYPLMNPFVPVVKPPPAQTRWPLIIGIIIVATVIGISAVLYVRGRRLGKVRRRMHRKRRGRTRK